LDKWEGIGPTGTTVYLIEVEGQKTAYIVIDGNNMVPGLREKIIEVVKKTGVDEAEVMTSDTHIVNAVSLNPRGYNPVGLVGDHKKLINTIVNMVKEALVKVQPVKVAYSIKNAEKIKIVGEKQMETLTSQILKSVSTAKKSTSILVSAALLNILLLFSLFFLLKII
jgi:putative membrane protein